MAHDRRIHPNQMEGWVAKLQMNMRKFLEDDGKNLSNEEKLEFIRKQYSFLDVTVKALEGKVYFVGCTHPELS
jgi:hypothetical protein